MTDTDVTLNQNPSVQAFAAMSAGEPLRPYQFTPPALSPLDVEIEISHCGMCHTDLHLIQNDFGLSTYPLVPGHEIVGRVSQIGTAVTGISLGQRVGVGWLAGACFSCEQCSAGKDNLCPSGQPTCLGREGGYATHVRVDSRLAFSLPDSLPSEYAAPLLCAGITVFAPLLRHGVTGTTRLGSFGSGG